MFASSRSWSLSCGCRRTSRSCSSASGGPRTRTPSSIATGSSCFDNGAGFGNAEIESTFTPRATAIEDALPQHGISLADVTGAANCHLHFDHSGQNVRIPKGVPIFVQRAEWAKVHEPDYTVAEWIDAPGLTYELLDGEIEVAPGLRLDPHARPHGRPSVARDRRRDGRSCSRGRRCSREPSGRVRRNPRRPAPRPHPIPAYPASVERLRSFDPVRVHFAHDRAVWER